MEGKTLRQQKDDGWLYCGVLELDPQYLRGVPVALVGSGRHSKGHRLGDLTKIYLVLEAKVQDQGASRVGSSKVSLLG